MTKQKRPAEVSGGHEATLAGLASTSNSTTKPPACQLSNIIYCEQCGRREVIPDTEAARRLDESGNLLCTDCFERPIDPAAGGLAHWCVCDSLFQFLAELEQRRIVTCYDNRVWHCLRRAYRRMARARYLTAADRLAWEV